MKLAFDVHSIVGEYAGKCTCTKGALRRSLLLSGAGDTDPQAFGLATNTFGTCGVQEGFDLIGIPAGHVLRQRREASFQQRERLRPEDEVLAGARAGPPTG